MCGRYVLMSKVKAIEKKFGVTADDPEEILADPNIGVGALGAVIACDNPDKLQLFQFGMTPFWAEKPMYLFNVRSEGDQNPDDDPNFKGAKGILQKPAFRKAIRSQRCLVIADGFFEGSKEKGLQEPYLVYLRDGKRPFAMAGIWDEWINNKTGEIKRGFAIITVPANDLLQKIGHHRSPVILQEGEERKWLDVSTPLSEITSMLLPYPAEEMNAYRVSSEIKNQEASDFSLLLPIGERVYPEYSFEIVHELELFGMGETRSRRRRNKSKDDKGQLDLFS